MLAQVEPQSGLLVLAMLELREVDSKVELLELVLTAHLDPIEPFRIVAVLGVDGFVIEASCAMSDLVGKLFHLFWAALAVTRVAIRYEWLCA